MAGNGAKVKKWLFNKKLQYLKKKTLILGLKLAKP